MALFNSNRTISRRKQVKVKVIVSEEMAVWSPLESIQSNDCRLLATHNMLFFLPFSTVTQFVCPFFIDRLVKTSFLLNDFAFCSEICVLSIHHSELHSHCTFCIALCSTFVSWCILVCPLVHCCVFWCISVNCF